VNVAGMIDFMFMFGKFGPAAEGFEENRLLWVPCLVSLIVMCNPAILVNS
jgi:hypothetical protein